MDTYKVDFSKKRDYENGFHLTCETRRMGKFINHLEIYKQIIGLPGDVLEFGVYKGTSFTRLISFRDLFEHSSSRRLIGFDAFGKFPDELALESDQEFVEKFESAGGYGISKEDLTKCLELKNTENFELVEGDITKTLPTFLEKNPFLKIALLHIDVDVYEPSKVILEHLWDKVVKGGILMLDDYALVEGETKAVDEFFQGQDIKIRKPDYCFNPSYIVK